MENSRDQNRKKMKVVVLLFLTVGIFLTLEKYSNFLEKPPEVTKEQRAKMGMDCLDDAHFIGQQRDCSKEFILEKSTDENSHKPIHDDNY